MANGTLIIVLLVIFFILLLCGTHVSSILFFLGFAGIWVVGGWGLLRGFIINEAFHTVASYSLTTIPIYIIMAQFFMKSGAVSTVYQLVFNMSRGKKGPLGVLTIVLGGLLGAVSGSSSATAASLGRISHNELVSRGYSPVLSASVAASSGSLSSIVPPSNMLIIYGITAGASIGQLFMGALIPGLLTVLVFCVTLVPLLVSKRERQFAEKVNSEYQMEKVTPGKAIISVASFILIIGIIFGGIYTGFATPTEAGALGAVIAFIVALLNKQVDKKFLLDSMKETAGITVMCLTVLLGGTMFGRVITLSGLTKGMLTAMAPIIANPPVLLAIIGVFYFIMFMFLDGTSTYILTIPILLPVVQAAGFDIVWFGVFISLICTLGCLSPPVGFSVYAVSSVVKDVPMGSIFKYAMVFAVVAFIVVGGLLIFFPALATYLPSTML